MTTTEQDRIQAEIDAMRAEARAKAKEFDAKYVTHRRAMGRAVIASGGKIERAVPTVRELMEKHGFPIPSEEQQQRNLELNMPQMAVPHIPRDETTE